jgi:hypothetical protein
MKKDEKRGTPGEFMNKQAEFMNSGGKKNI